MTACRPHLSLALAGLLLAACGRPVPALHADAASVRERTVPPEGRLRDTRPLTRDTYAAHAGWRVETPMAWSEYATWVEAQLHDFRVIERARLRMRLSRQLQGDLYMVEVAAAPGAGVLTVDVSFRATPF